MASQMDYLILRAIGSNRTESKGRIKSNGTTIKEITDRVESFGETVSRQKITQTLKKFIELGYVEEGLSIGRSKSYIITDLGIKSLIEIFGMEE